MTEYKLHIVFIISFSLVASLSYGESENGKSFDNRSGIVKTGIKKIEALNKEDLLVETKEKYKINYNPAGKKDPFYPLVREVIEPVVPDEKEGIEKTELQKYELTQLKLVAVMKFGAKEVAMVEDPEGKGHTLYVGTLIGKNWGKVVMIDANKVQIEEKTRAGSLIKELVMLTGEGK